ncbi:MAG: ATP-binding cassette domain-containing protein [Pseudomonadota bacterium]
MIAVQGLRKSVAGRDIIAGVDLRVGAGEICCLAGPSGLGKTTLLEIMAGLRSPDAGRVERRAPVAVAFQDDVLLPWLDAAGNLDYALAALPAHQRQDLRRQWLDRFDLPGELRPAAMSGGMRRRLTLARAFAAGRPLLLLDEPFAFLDAQWQQRVAEEIGQAALAGAAIFIISHQFEALSGLNCRIIRPSGAPLTFCIY